MVMVIRSHSRIGLFLYYEELKITPQKVVTKSLRPAYLAKVLWL